jgi:signal transduction histidine kinase/phage shock protein PspC (stress-responsive transcriptional regulator)
VSRRGDEPQAPLIAGVCAYLADRLGIDAIIVRIAFVALAVAGGVGVGAYILIALLMPRRRARLAQAAGHNGNWEVAAGAGLLALAGMLALREAGIWTSDRLVWPTLLAAVGAALVWRQTATRTPPAEETARPERELRDEPEPASRASVYRGGFGLALIAGAALLVLQAVGALDAARDAVLTIVVVTLALVLMLAPFVWRLGRSVTVERSARIRSQERAEVAAHLHDSVLQTLALVQKQADDPRAVATLARRQERELRAWLSGSTTGDETTLRGALEAAAERVEEDHGVQIDLVAVGDRPLDERGEAIVAATREAMVNAAKFAGSAGPVSVFAEAQDGRAHVFVRDRGPGFDPAAVPPERHGVRESIIGRMERYGGHAAVRGVEGGGTEVELEL